MVIAERVLPQVEPGGAPVVLAGDPTTGGLLSLSETSPSAVLSRVDEVACGRAGHEHQLGAQVGQPQGTAEVDHQHAADQGDPLQGRPDDVLAEVGYSSEEIAEFRHAGVIG